MTRTIQSVHNFRWLRPCDRHHLHFTTRSLPATDLDWPWPPYSDLARFFISPSSSHNLPAPLNISARHLENRYCFAVRNWRIPSQNGILLEFSSWLNNHAFLANWTDWGLSSYYCGHSKVARQFISLLVPLRPAVGLWPPANSCILSFRLTITLNLCLLLFRTQLQKAFSLYAGALSLWHSLPQ